jgi:hypothetical protein
MTSAFFVRALLIFGISAHTRQRYIVLKKHRNTPATA